MKQANWVVRIALSLSTLAVMSITGAALMPRSPEPKLPVPLSFVDTQSQSAAGGRAMSFTLSTQSFAPGGEIPRKYTCEGDDLSPELSWSEPPKGTQSFALIADDPDAPSGTFTHWVLYDVPAEMRQLAEGASRGQLPAGASQGRNGFGKTGYGGPCPPPGKPHRYFFKLYALDANLGLKPGASKQQLEQAMKGHVLAQSEVVGTFKR